MTVDYPGAIDMMLPINYSFNSVDPLVIVEHCTGGDLTIEAVHNTFLQTMRSTHFAIGRDGRVAQFVPLSRGAGGNCCPDGTHSTFWDQYIPTYPNLNLCTISIEHCNDSQQSLPLTQAQMDASNKLNLWLCQKFGIDTAHIKGHSSIDATNCPGQHFDFNQLFSYINKGGADMGVPTGWKDDGTTLTAPNGHHVVLGFRDWILNHPWNPADQPRSEQYHANPLEESNKNLGEGDKLVCEITTLEYTPTMGVFVAWIGQEYDYVLADRDNVRTLLSQAMTQISELKAGLPRTDINNAIAAMSALSQDLTGLLR